MSNYMKCPSLNPIIEGNAHKKTTYFSSCFSVCVCFSLHCMSHTLITYCNIIISLLLTLPYYCYVVVPFCIHKSLHNSFSQEFSLLFHAKERKKNLQICLTNLQYLFIISLSFGPKEDNFSVLGKILQCGAKKKFPFSSTHFSKGEKNKIEKLSVVLLVLTFL